MDVRLQTRNGVAPLVAVVKDDELYEKSRGEWINLGRLPMRPPTITGHGLGFRLLVIGVPPGGRRVIATSTSGTSGNFVSNSAVMSR